MLEQIADPIASLSADGAYDTKTVYEAAHERGGGRAVRVLIPPGRNAQFSPRFENQIADRRELYNETVNNFNIRQDQFPDVLIANNFGFKPADLLQFDESELENVDMNGVFD